MKLLLEYQEIDANLRKAKAKLINSESRKKAGTMQEYLKDSQNKLLELDKSAESSIKHFDQLKKQCEDCLKKIEKATSTNEIEGAEASKLVEELAKIERELINTQNRLISINKDFENLMKNAKTAKSNLMFYKQEYEKIKEQETPSIKKLEEELNVAKAKVKPELLAKYNIKAEGKVFPIFVPLTNGRCGGCRMEIPAGKLKDVQSKKFIECENCGRYIYYEN